MSDITIPTDIQRMIRAHATLQGMTPDAYCNRWWADVRRDVAVRGGIEAIEAANAARRATQTKPEQEAAE